MAMSKFGTYDDDYATVGQVKSIVTGDVSILEGQVNTLPKSYGTQPQPPYTRGSTYVDSNGKLYTCVTPRSVGEFNQSDWIESVPTNKIIQYANNSPETSRINKSKLDSDLVTVATLNAFRIDADHINAGTLSSFTINAGTITGGTINGTTISGSLNIGSGSAVLTNWGSNTAYIYMHGDNTYLRSEHGMSISSGGAGISGDLTNNPNNLVLRAGSGGTSTKGHIGLEADGGVYLTGATGVYAAVNKGTNYKIQTDGGGAISSKIIKTNIVPFDNSTYKTALNLLKNMNIYEYDYKYELDTKKHQFGFIIDELIDNSDANLFFDFKDVDATIISDKVDFGNLSDGEHIHLKEYDRDLLTKYLLVCIKALQNKIDELEVKLNEG